MKILNMQELARVRGRFQIIGEYAVTLTIDNELSSLVKVRIPFRRFD